MKKDKNDIDEKDQKIQELNEKYLRALADYQNLEKRMVSDRDEGVKRGLASFIRELVGVLDLLYKASNHLNDDGLRLAVKELEGVLEKHGVIRIETQGKQFDPAEMECVEVTESDDDGKVSEEIRPGYKIGEVIIRPAQVKVGKKQVVEKEEELAKQELQTGDYM